jgi:hypothetical protein
LTERVLLIAAALLVDGLSCPYKQSRLDRFEVAEELIVGAEGGYAAGLGLAP